MSKFSEFKKKNQCLKAVDVSDARIKTTQIHHTERHFSKMNARAFWHGTESWLTH